MQACNLRRESVVLRRGTPVEGEGATMPELNAVQVVRPSRKPFGCSVKLTLSPNPPRGPGTKKKFGLWEYRVSQMAGGWTGL